MCNSTPIMIVGFTAVLTWHNHWINKYGEYAVHFLNPASVSRASSLSAISRPIKG